MSSNNETGCIKTIGLLAGIATVIGVIIAILNWLMPFNPIGSSPLVSSSTEQSVNIEVPILVTNTLLHSPTNTPLLPPTELHPTPIPNTSPGSILNTPLLPPTELHPTPIPNTSPGSILNVGQSWKENNFELTLVYANYNYICQDFGAPEIVLEIKFELTNRSLNDLPIRYSLASVSAQSNLGESLAVGYYGGNTYSTCGYTDWVNNFESIDTIIRARQTIELITDNYLKREQLLIRADFTNPSLTEIIISVSNIADVANARWRIPVYH